MYSQAGCGGAMHTEQNMYLQTMFEFWHDVVMRISPRGPVPSLDISWRMQRYGCCPYFSGFLFEELPTLSKTCLREIITVRKPNEQSLALVITRNKLFSFTMFGILSVKIRPRQSNQNWLNSSTVPPWEEACRRVTLSLFVYKSSRREFPIVPLRSRYLLLISLRSFSCTNPNFKISQTVNCHHPLPRVGGHVIYLSLLKNQLLIDTCDLP